MLARHKGWGKRMRRKEEYKYRATIGWEGGGTPDQVRRIKTASLSAKRTTEKGKLRGRFGHGKGTKKGDSVGKVFQFWGAAGCGFPKPHQGGERKCSIESIITESDGVD